MRHHRALFVLSAGEVTTYRDNDPGGSERRGEPSVSPAEPCGLSGQFRLQIEEERDMPRLPSLHVYALRHPELEQAAWVRATTSSEASIEFSRQNDIPVIVPNDYGWVPFPEGRQRSDDDERPLPRWEYLLAVHGPADIRGMPEHLRALAEHRAPRRPGQAKLGREFPRSTPVELSSIPYASVPGPVQVFHSGFREPYNLKATGIWGYHVDFDSVGVGKAAMLDLYEARTYPTTGDVVRLRAKVNGSDHLVTGKVTGVSLILDVLAIEAIR